MNQKQQAILVLGIILIGTIVPIFMITDFDLSNSSISFIAESKPEKPDLTVQTIQDPSMIAIFDSLYQKYPDIKQTDIDKAHADLSIQCLETTDYEKESGFTQLTIMAFCKGYMNGTIDNWLEAMDIPYYNSGSSLLAPELL